jgi:hypothetical protein
MHERRLKLLGKLSVDTFRLAALDMRDRLETARNVKGLRNKHSCDGAAEDGKPQSAMRAD